MLALRINDRYLDLDPAVSVNFNLTNPIFDRDGVSRIYTFPFLLPATEKNKEITAHADRLDAVRKLKYINAVVEIAGIPFEKGTLTLKKATERGISAVFQNTAIQKQADLDDTKLTDLSIPVNIPYFFDSEYILSATWSPANQLDLAYQAIEINGETFVAPLGDHAAFAEKINAKYPGTTTVLEESQNYAVFQIVTPDPETPFYINTQTAHLSTDFFLQLVLEQQAGDQDLPAVPVTSVAVKAHLTSTLSGEESHVFPCFYSETFTEKNDIPFFFRTLLNNYIADDYTYSPPRTQKAITESHVPIPFLKNVLQAAAEKIGLNASVGAIDDDPELRKLLLFANAASDDIVTESFGDFERYHNVGKLNFNVADGLPDISAGELLRKLSSTFALIYEFDNSVLRTRFIRDILRTAVADWTQYATPEFQNTFSTTDGYTLSYQSDDTTNDLPQLQEVKIGAGKKNYPTGCAIMRNIIKIANEKIYYERKMPHIEVEGTNTALRVKNIMKEAYLTFWRGIQTDVFSDDYPMAAHDDTDQAGQVIAAATLAWDGENGRFEKYWKELIRLETAGDIIEKVLILPIPELIQLKKFNNPRKKITHKNGEMTGVIQKAQFKVSAKSISATKITFIQQ